jgi:hypothetical protein
MLTINEISKPRVRKSNDGREKQRVEHNKMLMVLEVEGKMRGETNMSENEMYVT